MQIRPSLDPKISKVARDNPKHLILLQIANQGEHRAVKNAKQTKKRVKQSYFSYAQITP
jgi:hypothetical protein